MESPLDTNKIEGSNDEKPKDLAARIGAMNLLDWDEDFPEMACDLCNKSFSTTIEYQQHVNSKKHNQAIFKEKLRRKLRKDAAPKPEEANKDDDSPPNSDLIEVLYCDVCNKQITGYINYQAHLNGNIHARNLRQQQLKEKMKGMKEFLQDDTFDVESDEDGIFQKPFAQCTPCQKTFYGPEPYQQHLNGVNHKRKLTNLKLIDCLKKDGDFDNGIEDEEAFTKCDVCNKSFSGPVPFKIHLKSPVHERELKRREVEKELKDFYIKDPTSDQYICKECKKVFPDPLSFKSHLANNSHGKLKVKDELFGFVSSNPEIVAVKSVQNVSSDEEGEEKESFQNGHYFLVCKLCHMTFSGPQSAQDHLKSKNHVKAKREKAERKRFFQEKMKEKRNGGPSTDQKDNSGSEGKSKMPTANGNKTGSVSQELNGEDFEFI